MSSRSLALRKLPGEHQIHRRLLVLHVAVQPTHKCVDRQLGAATTEPDVEAVLHSLTAARARRAGDTSALRAEAAAFQQYGTAHGIPSVVAESAVLWLHAGDPDRATLLLHRLAGPGLNTIAEDVDYLLTLSCLVDVAAGTGESDLARDGAVLLQPYAGRAILNAGAVSFHGVVDDYLYRAQRAAGHDEACSWYDCAALCYQRIGATWWHRQLTDTTNRQTPAQAAVTVHLYHNPNDTWTVGRGTATILLPDLRGLHYLRYLLSRPGWAATPVHLDRRRLPLRPRPRPAYPLAARDHRHRRPRVKLRAHDRPPCPRSRCSRPRPGVTVPAVPGSARMRTHAIPATCPSGYKPCAR